MQARVLLNIILLALIAILGSFIYFGDNNTSSQPLQTNQINTIEIHHLDRQVLLNKINEQWVMTKPINIPANTFRVNTLLKFLNISTDNGYDTNALQLSKYGLEKPATSIRFSNNTHSTVFEFGITHPVNKKRYVKNDGHMHLIEDNFYPLVSSQIGTLISHRLLPDNANIISLQLPQQVISKNHNTWQLEPDNSSLSTDDIHAFVEEWQRAQAFGAHNYLPRKPLATINVRYISNSDTHNASFDITDVDPWLIIARPELDIEYHFNPEFYDRLLRPGHQLDKAVLDAEQQLLEQHSLQ